MDLIITTNELTIILQAARDLQFSRQDIAAIERLAQSTDIDRLANEDAADFMRAITTLYELEAECDKRPDAKWRPAQEIAMRLAEGATA